MNSSDELFQRSWEGYFGVKALNNTRTSAEKVRHDSTYIILFRLSQALQQRHNEPGDVSNHHPHDYLGHCEVNSPLTGEYPHNGPVTRKMFPFDDVIIPLWRYWFMVVWSHWNSKGISALVPAVCVI